MKYCIAKIGFIIGLLAARVGYADESIKYVPIINDGLIVIMNRPGFVGDVFI